jgi:hypothetical protein
MGMFTLISMNAVQEKFKNSNPRNSNPWPSIIMLIFLVVAMIICAICK